MLLDCVLEKILESPLDCKEIQPVHPKGDQPWVFFGRNDAKAETPVLGDGQGGLACCNSCGPKESDTTEQLN